jgi:hypothetical protein
MAIHHQLPIYKVAYNLADLAIDLIKNMPREVKAVIGSELRDECLRLLVLIFRANVSTDKRTHLTELIERQQVVELLLRLSRDKRFISTGQYARAVQLTESIGKQANGWRKASASSPVT